MDLSSSVGSCLAFSELLFSDPGEIGLDTKYIGNLLKPVKEWIYSFGVGRGRLGDLTLFKFTY